MNTTIKKLPKLFFLLILIWFLTPLTLHAQYSAIAIVGTNVNMRETPSTTSKVIQKLETPNVGSFIEKGKLEKIGDKEDFWYKIKWNDKIGWVYGAFTSLAQGAFAIEGSFADCWYSDQSGDGGCRYTLEIKKKDDKFFGTIAQGYPGATEGQLFPEQNLEHLLIDEITGAISFNFNLCTNVDFSGEKPKETWALAKVKGHIKAKAITFEIETETGYGELAILLRNMEN